MPPESDKQKQEPAETNGQVPNTGMFDMAANAVAEAIDTRSPRKPAQRILEQQISEGLKEIERSTSGLLMSGLSAGMDLGFSVLLMAALTTLDKGALPRPINEILVAMAYALGFILVIIGRSELFTEHTALAVMPVLNRRASVPQLLRLWALVFISNMVGGAIFAVLAVKVGTALGTIEPTAFGQIAHNVIDHPDWVILLSAVLAGWLMGLCSWMVAASRETIAQVVLILLITTTIGLIHLHHAVAGSIEVLAGLFAGQGITVGDYLRFLAWTTLGNSIGGVVFVAIVKYGHVIQSTGQNTEEVNIE